MESFWEVDTYSLTVAFRANQVLCWRTLQTYRGVSHEMKYFLATAYLEKVTGATLQKLSIEGV